MLRAIPGSTTLAGTFGGLVGGMTQAYAIMGLTTTMVGSTTDVIRKLRFIENRGDNTNEITFDTWK
jgi:hypothetical protein